MEFELRPVGWRASSIARIAIRGRCFDGLSGGVGGMFLKPDLGVPNVSGGGPRFFSLRTCSLGNSVCQRHRA